MSCHGNLETTTQETLNNVLVNSVNSKNNYKDKSSSRCKNDMNSKLSRKVPNSHYRKRPHMLPPLTGTQQQQNTAPGPIEPLAPPSMLSLEAGNSRLGSPTPRWHRPTAEELQLLQENGMDGRPAIRLTACYDEEVLDKKRKDSVMILELKNDPLYKQDDVGQHPESDDEGVVERRHTGVYMPKRYAPLKPIKKNLD